MQLTVLGAAPAYSNRPGSAASSYLVRTNGTALVLDLGQGAFANLAAVLEPSRIDTILITHLHPDHFVDLVPLRHYLKWELETPRRVKVVGPAGLVERLDGLLGEPGFAAATLEVAALTEGSLQVGPLAIEVRQVTHTSESYAVRVAPANGGPTGSGTTAGLVYSGDCGQAEELIPLIRAGDTLLTEASFGAGPAAPEAHHLTADEAARVAARCRAGRLLLTHVLPGRSRAEALDAAESVFTGPTQLVIEGDRFEI